MTAMTRTCLLLLLATPVLAGDWQSKGEVSTEARAFTDDQVAQTKDTGLALFARLEAGYRNRGLKLKVRGFSRTDHEDESRNLTKLEEAYLSYRKKDWEIQVGWQMLNWTATEAFHPADIVNSRNLDSDLERPERLGELMLSLKRRIGNGAVTAYYLPRFEEPVLPEGSSRLSYLPVGFKIGEALWIEDENHIAQDSWDPQYGLRFSQVMGNADISLHYLDHLDRQQPLGLIDFQSGLFTPVYVRVEDIGATYLHILGDWILKVEANHRDFIEQQVLNPSLNQPDHTQFAFGLDYGWNQDGGGETTLILEGQTVLGLEKEERAAISAFQRDLLIGCRYAFNDTMSREILATIIVDVERSREWLFNFSYQQRLSDVWHIETGLRWIEAPPKEPVPVGLEILDEANQFFLRISRRF